VIHATPRMRRMSSFLFLSLKVRPSIHRNILISVNTDEIVFLFVQEIQLSLTNRVSAGRPTVHFGVKLLVNKVIFEIMAILDRTAQIRSHYLSITMSLSRAVSEIRNARNREINILLYLTRW